ncbi:MAG: SET domain-containing protein-lysine N-methyltransferase [Acidobacteria bacterium]|nr:SET domain-containing protein-lysine N-methyltransferase [Acidobacteriota bacterium]
MNGTNNGNTPHLAYAPLIIDGTRIKMRSRVAGQLVKLPDDLPLPQIERRRSSLHGWGVFALERIPKNRRIIYYSGQLVPSKESHVREADYLEEGCIWCFELSHRWAVDANFGGNVSRYINHACKPNSYTQIIDGIIWIRASRTIDVGEELTYDYHTGGTAEIACQCRPDCTGII